MIVFRSIIAAFDNLVLLDQSDAAASYLQTFWKHTKAVTTYPGLLRLQREGQLGTALRLLLAFSASTASFEVSIHTITALLLVSCTSKLSDMQLDWQALCTLNRLRIKERSETASPEGPTNKNVLIKIVP